MTVSYHELEKSVFETIRDKKFKRIPGKPTWQNKEDLLAEAADVAIECEVHYAWAGDFGMLAEIVGPVRYLADTGLVYVAPVAPPEVVPDNIRGGTQVAVRTWTDNNSLERKSWAIVKGFR